MTPSCWRKEEGKFGGRVLEDCLEVANRIVWSAWHRMQFESGWASHTRGNFGVRD